MTFKDARALRDLIRETGIHCTVPTGYAPDGYFARIVTTIGSPTGAGLPKDLRDHADWEAWEAYRASMSAMEERERKRARLGTMPRPRSPLDVLIDRACGIKEEDYR